MISRLPLSSGRQRVLDGAGEDATGEAEAAPGAGARRTGAAVKVSTTRPGSVFIIGPPGLDVVIGGPVDCVVSGRIFGWCSLPTYL